MFLKSLSAALLLVTVLSACATSPAVPAQSTVRYPAQNLGKDNYKPGEEWRLVWSDEFEGDSINSGNWSAFVAKAGRFNDEWQRYTDSANNAYIDNGCLVIKANHEGDTHATDQYSSARLHTARKQTWQYGKIAARIQLPYGEGLWPAFWMLGANIDENGGDTPWPQSGEIDILELYGSKNDAVVEANIHYADQSDAHAMMGAASFRLEQGKFADNFHVFELEWDESKIAWLVDGEEYASADISADEFSEFHKEFFILLNIAVGGTYAGRPDATTPFPQYMYTDWVRVYEK
ncbi:MAG: glycoside hydrolase family 16 protein [Arenicella sp.]|nr:glycoside hydrolase family 16 protein [Arenicella sp.]